MNSPACVATNSKMGTGAKVATQSIGEILKGLKFKSPKKTKKRIKNSNLIDHDLLYIQRQMTKTKKTPRKPKGRG